MEALAREVLARLPLAEAVLTAWNWLADDAFLDDLLERHRGRCYTRAIRFADDHRRVRARESFGRLSLPLSMAFLAGCTTRLREVFPDPQLGSVPASLADRQVIALVAWRRLLTVEETNAGLGVPPGAAAVRERLAGLLTGVWRDDWVKARRKKAPPPTRPDRGGAGNISRSIGSEHNITTRGLQRQCAVENQTHKAVGVSPWLPTAAPPGLEGSRPFSTHFRDAHPSSIAAVAPTATDVSPRQPPRLS